MRVPLPVAEAPPRRPTPENAVSVALRGVTEREGNVEGVLANPTGGEKVPASSVFEGDKEG